MYWNRSAADIAAAWQVEIESKFETGATAVLLGGAPNGMVTGVTTLLGLQNSTRQRHDVATPVLVAGGNSATWLGLLLPPLPASSGPIAPPPTLVYGGADEATYLAVVGLAGALAEQTVPALGPARVSTLQEIGMNFAPRLQPGAATAWEMLPFTEVGEQPTPALALTTAPPDSSADWIAWGMMLLAFCLVFSALLI